jgi:hypothetical protein
VHHRYSLNQEVRARAMSSGSVALNLAFVSYIRWSTVRCHHAPIRTLMNEERSRTHDARGTPPRWLRRHRIRGRIPDLARQTLHRGVSHGNRGLGFRSSRDGRDVRRIAASGFAKTRWLQLDICMMGGSPRPLCDRRTTDGVTSNPRRCHFQVRGSYKADVQSDCRQSLRLPAGNPAA